MPAYSEIHQAILVSRMAIISQIPTHPFQDLQGKLQQKFRRRSYPLPQMLARPALLESRTRPTLASPSIDALPFMKEHVRRLARTRFPTLLPPQAEKDRHVLQVDFFFGE